MTPAYWILLVVLLLPVIFGIALWAWRATDSGRNTLGCLAQFMFMAFGVLSSFVIADWERQTYPDRLEGVTTIAEGFFLIWYLVLFPAFTKFLDLLRD